MRYFKLEDLNVSDFTLSNEIYSLQIRTEDRTKWIVINYSEMYKYSEWSISEAIEHYLSDEGRTERYASWYRAWCD